MSRKSVLGALFLVTASSASAQLVSVQLDYPPELLLAGVEGIVGFEVDLAKDGKVEGCRITQNSGNAALDKQTCVQLRKTGYFKPVSDAEGRPIRATYASRLRWSIPHPPPETSAGSAPK